MAKLMQPFNAAQFDPTQSAGSLPIGRLPVVATKSEVTPVKAGDGGMLVYTLEVIDGPHKGSTGPYRLNLYNKEPKAVEIAQRQMAAMCWCTGVQNVEDSAQLHGIPFIIDVGLQKEPNENKYTEIKKLFDINGNEPDKNKAPNIVMPQSGPMTHIGEQQVQQPQQSQPQQQPQQQQPQQSGGGSWGNVASGGAQGSNVANNVQMPQEQQQQPQQAAGGAWGGNQQQPQQQPAQGGGSWGSAGNAQGGQPSNGQWGQRQ